MRFVVNTIHTTRPLPTIVKREMMENTTTIITQPVKEKGDGSDFAQFIGLSIVSILIGK